MLKRSVLKFMVLVFIASFFTIGCRVKLDPVRILTFQEKLSELFINPKVNKLKNTVNNFTIYNFEIDQFLEKSNKDLGVFRQQFKLVHFNEELPVVVRFVTDFNSEDEFEFSNLFKANYLYIKSRNVLNQVAETYKNEQNTSNDFHYIISQLKRIYTGKWLSFGNYLEANNALTHRSFYPWDVEVTIVKKPNFTLLSKETLNFLENRGKKIIYVVTEENTLITIQPHVDALVIDENKNTIESYIPKLKQWLGYSVNFIN